MVAFEVQDMSCGGCAASITRSLKALDGTATVHVDVARRRVEVRGSALDTVALGARIASAGYTPIPVGSAAVTPPAENAQDQSS
jgi:copper chaperone